MPKKQETPAQEPAQAQQAPQTVQNEPGSANENPPGPASDAPQTVPATIYTVCFGSGLNVREGPGYGHLVRRVLPFGSAVMSAGEPVQDDAGNVWMPVLDGYALMAYLIPDAVAV